MSWLTELFGGSGGDSGGWTEIPKTAEQKKAEERLAYYGLEAVPEFPTAPVAELTETEQILQNQLREMAGQPLLPETYKRALSALIEVLGGKTAEQLLAEPAMTARKSLEETRAEEARTALIAQNRMNIGAGGLGRLMQLIEQTKTQNIASELGRQSDIAQQAQLAALGLAPQYYGFEQFAPTQQLTAMEQLASIPRMQEQAQQTAAYEAAMQKLLFPYQAQVPILQNLLNTQQFAYQQPTQQSSGLSSLLPYLAVAALPAATGFLTGLTSGAGTIVPATPAAQLGGKLQGWLGGW